MKMPQELCPEIKKRPWRRLPEEKTELEEKDEEDEDEERNKNQILSVNWQLSGISSLRHIKLQHRESSVQFKYGDTF